MEEKVIDLRLLCYKALTKWRNIIVFAIIIGLLAGAYGLVKDLKILFNEEDYNAAYSAFEIEHNGWAATETTLKNEMETIQTSQARQIEYNENSVLMKIDPLQKYRGSMILYVDYDYQILPELTYQNIDYTGRIMDSYSKFMLYGEMYKIILQETDQVSELKYLQEILSAWTDQATSTINVFVTGVTEADVQELLDAVYNAILSESGNISGSIAEHTLTKMSETVYSEVDFDLADTQEANTAFIAECDQALQEVALELDEWEKEAEPLFDYSSWGITKNVIKMLLIGGFAGVFLGFCWYAAVYVLSPKLQDSAYWITAKISYFGLVWENANSHRHFHKIDTLVDRIFGLQPLTGGLAYSCALVGANINAAMKNAGYTKTAVISTVSAQEVQPAVAQMQKQSEGELCYVGDILSMADAVTALKSYDSVVIAAKEGGTSVEDIARQKELLQLWGKNLSGAFSFR